MIQNTVIAAVALVTVGCGGVHRGPTFSGIREDRLVPAHEIGRAESVPDGYARIGRVAARCSPVGDLSELDDEALANVDCTNTRLQRALAEAAAEAGGELLVALECRPRAGDLSCEALVARPKDETRARRSLDERQPAIAAPAPSPREVEFLDEPHASHAWAINVSFEGKPGAPERLPREPSAVTRTSELPPHQTPLGDARARCDREDCNARELEHALRVTAARAGADSLAGVRCFEAEESYECVGTLAALPVEDDGHVNRIE